MSITEADTEAYNTATRWSTTIYDWSTTRTRWWWWLTLLNIYKFIKILRRRIMSVCYIGLQCAKTLLSPYLELWMSNKEKLMEWIEFNLLVYSSAAWSILCRNTWL